MLKKLLEIIWEQFVQASEAYLETFDRHSGSYERRN